MKTLKNHTILFDAECPMCRAISKELVKSGLTSPDGTVPYQEFPKQACPILDRQRAANEIALINDETGEVSYGVESLFKLLAVSYPRLRPLLSFRPFIWLMSKLYAFISFNRRVILPSPDQTDRFSIQPTFRLDYRLAYLAFTWIISAAVLSAYADLPGVLPPSGNSYSVHIILIGLLFFQGAVIYVIDKSNVWDCLGNMMTIVTGGSIVLLPVLLLAPWIGLTPLFYQLWLAAASLLMHREYIRRSKALKLGAIPGLTAVLYLLLSVYIFYY